MQLRHAGALRLLDTIEPRTTPGVGLKARERLELGLLPGDDDDTRGVDSLHAAAVASLGLPDSHEAVVLGIRCLLALGELCRELECSERLGLIGGHQTVLRLMTEGQISGDARRVVQPPPPPPRPGKSEAGCAPIDKTCAPAAVRDSNHVAGGPPPAIEEYQEGEEDEVQSAAALVAANVLSSGSSFPMRASFPTGEGPSGLGRFPLRYEFVVASDDHCCAVNRTNRAHRATAVSAAAAAAATRVASGSTNSSIQAARGGLRDSESFSILVRPVKERQHSQFDVGFVMWPAAVILSRLLCRHPELVRGRRVLEIGAGLGLAGLVAARLQQRPAKLAEPANRGSAGSRAGGAASVTLSDFNPLVLRALEANVALNAGRRASAGAAEEAPDAEGGDCRGEGSADGIKRRPEDFCGEDVGTPTGRPSIRVRHLDWDKLGSRMPSVERGRAISLGEGGDPAQGSGPSLRRPCSNRGRDDDGSGGDCASDSDSDSNSDSGPLSDGSASRQQREGGREGIKGIEDGRCFDLIIASDHICQVRLTGALLASLCSVFLFPLPLDLPARVCM